MELLSKYNADYNIENCRGRGLKKVRVSFWSDEMDGSQPRMKS